MNLRSIIVRRLLACTGALVALASLAACGAGSGSVPSTGTQAGTPPASAHRAILSVQRSAAQAVIRKVSNATAHYAPVVGGKPRLLQLGSRKPLTVAAGNDLLFYGGPTQTGGAEYNILVNCADESCWGGKISQFQNDLFSSTMLGLLNQYGAGGSYRTGGNYSVRYDTSVTLQDADIFNIIHSVVTTYGLPTGYGAQYHVFLGQGVQQCSTSAGGCYGIQYCAYHGSNDYTDIGHVLYSTEPYQNIPGCQVPAGSPQGQVADSTASVLSHEMFETMTDPDVAVNVLAWYNPTFGEIGDLCAPANGVPVGNVGLGPDLWEIQPEYSNALHDCGYQ
ncbi:MAG: hypothetical protein NVS3B28_28450 [Candidatus Velthaea sp.]